MFGNLKNKLGDVADLKKYATPQVLSSLSGSRQRSSQHTPGSETPLSRHSRQPSTASLTGLPPVPLSPLQSPTVVDGGVLSPQEKEVIELQREVSKLRTTLENQQDAAMERIIVKEQEWKNRLKDSQLMVSQLEEQLHSAGQNEATLKGKLHVAKNIHTEGNSKIREAHLRVQGLENKVAEMQENYDQLEGFSTQESAKIKHILLTTNNELDISKEQLSKKIEALSTAEAQLASYATLDDRLRGLAEEKTEFESRVAGLQNKLSVTTSRLSSTEAEYREEEAHLKERINILEQRHSQSALQETDKVQALIKERETVEHRLEETRQQLNNIKSSWSEQIAANELQIQHLNTKIAEDQFDSTKYEEEKLQLQEDLSIRKTKMSSIIDDNKQMEKDLNSRIMILQEDVETLKWQLNTTNNEKDQQISSLQHNLQSREEIFNKTKSDLNINITKNEALIKQHNELQSNVSELNIKLSRCNNNITTIQSDNKSLNDKLQIERTIRENIDKERFAMEAKLDVLMLEKNKLLQNLDEYLDKVNILKLELKEKEDKCLSNESVIIDLTEQLRSKENQCIEWELKVSDIEDNLITKIQNSQLVQQLQQTITNLQNEGSKLKQASKVQTQRLADMKKTLQKELRLTTDSTDNLLSTETRSDGKPRTISPGPNYGSLGNNFSFHSSGSTSAIISSMNGGCDIDPLNLEYLKHVIIKFVTSREYEAVQLTRAVATLLHMSRDEEQLVRQTLQYRMSWFGSKPNIGKGQEAKAIPPPQ